METKKLIIFDLDGVLVNSFAAFYKLISSAMVYIGLTVSEKQYRDFFKGNVHKAFRKFIGDEELYRKFAEYRIAHYDEFYKEVTLFPGATQAVHYLAKSHILAIASAGRPENIIPMLETHKLDKCFHDIRTTGGKDKSELISGILANLNTSPDEGLMITDTSGDIMAAHSCKVPSIGVTWGFHRRKLLQNAGAYKVVDDFKELIDACNNILPTQSYPEKIQEK